MRLICELCGERKLSAIINIHDVMLAQMFAERGARVAMMSRSIATASSDRTLAIRGDVSEPESVERLFQETEARFGRCDILVNNAGMIDPATVVETDAPRWDRMFAVNVRSAFLTSRRALPHMIERRSGAIINVSSISGIAGQEKFPGFASYNASKAALISFTEALAVEVKKYGVRVNCVSPGSVDTQMWNEASGGAPAEMTPEEVAETIVFLASPRSRPMNGQNLHVYSV